MDKVNKILETDITAAIDAHKVYGKAVVKINDRMNYIIRYCVTMAGGKLEWWDWSSEDYESHSSGDFMLSYNHDVIQVRGEWTNNDNMVFIDKDGGEYGLEDGFPARWLYEDFEEEYTNGLKLYKEHKNQKAAKAKEKKLKNAAEQKIAMKKVLSKLTKEEKKVLGLGA